MENKLVLNEFLESQSLLEGHFLLSSGRHADRYIQCALLLQHPSKAEKVIEYVAEQTKNLGATVVLGPAMGGILVAYELARQLGVRTIFCERDAAAEMTLRRNFSLSPTDRVIIAEDVITTAKSALETARLIESLAQQS